MGKSFFSSDGLHALWILFLAVFLQEKTVLFQVGDYNPFMHVPSAAPGAREGLRVRVQCTRQYHAKVHLPLAIIYGLEAHQLAAQPADKQKMSKLGANTYLESEQRDVSSIIHTHISPIPRFCHA